jgi:RHS repeat-associated protein
MNANLLSASCTLTPFSRTVELTGAVAAGSVGVISGGTVSSISQGVGETGEPGGFRTLVQLGSPDGAMLRTTVSSGSTTREGYLYVPPAEEVLGYDQRGNLIKDARWEYTWDVNNSLVELYEIPMATMAGGNAGLDGHYPLRMIRLAYDYKNRRIAKKVFVEQSGTGLQPVSWRLTKDLRFVYDGWHMIAELDATFATGTGVAGITPARGVVRTYLWGPDVSGTMTGAGGVGGLLAFTFQGDSYYPISDANGNITAIHAPGIDQVIRFDYDPFGNRITNTGPDVELCPFGGSTKYTDAETGLVDYGMRIYSPQWGRFISADPIEEEGGVNLYGFVGNDAVNRVDYLGMVESRSIYVLLGPNFPKRGGPAKNLEYWLTWSSVSSAEAVQRYVQNGKTNYEKRTGKKMQMEQATCRGALIQQPNISCFGLLYREQSP